MKYCFSILFSCIYLLCSAQIKTKDLNGCNWKFKQVGGKKWNTASVPGTVHTDLFANKLIPDPFYGNNEKSLQWIEDTDWEYQCAFNVAAPELTRDHIQLVFKGLDTYASVYLNDSLILSADNMFREWTVDVKSVVKPGKNELRIVFFSAVKKGKEEASKLNYVLPGDEKVFTRKAQYQYGWDWGPRFVTCGIWKAVQLVMWDDARLLNVQFVQKALNDSFADIEFLCEIQSDVDANAYIDIDLTGENDFSKQRTSKISLQKGINNYVVGYTIKDPNRWWTNGLGIPYLYHFNVDLSYNSKILDGKKIDIGLRTIEFMQQKDSAGTSFYFKLNGVPVFMKGANFIPADNFIPRISTTQYENIVRTAADASMNMLRVWGGGIYEQDVFYELCDKMGILVWQDMMFACAMYPGDKKFVSNVEEEVTQQVKRLRNHACIALWCGNNEIDEGWKNWGWQKQYNYSAKDSASIADDYRVLFEQKIRNSVEVNDGSRAYWPSSPSIGWGRKESLLQGDVHFWGVWWGMEPFEVYSEKVGRFMSEYGFQGMPALNTLYKNGLYKQKKKGESLFEDEYGSDLYSHVIDSVVLNAHQKHPTGYKTIQTYMQREYKVPQGRIENYIYVSQLLQAKGLKVAIEAHRRAKSYCMGTLYWQLNDCWPVTSWSTVDHYGNYKAAHYQVKRLYKDLVVSVADTDSDSCAVFIVSDLQKNIKGELSVSLRDLDGKILLSNTIPVEIDSNSSRAYFYFDKKVINSFQKENVFLKADLIANDGSSATAGTLYYFVKDKELMLKKGTFNVKETVCDKGQCFIVSSDVLLKNAMISVEGQEMNLSDNYFDMLPHQEYLIHLPLGIKIKNIQKKIKIVSLVDTY